MVVQYKAIDKRFTQSQLLDLFNENVAELKKEIYRETALTLANMSPVDTGTYATSHEVVVAGEGTGERTSRGKPRNQPVKSYQMAGYGFMLDDIASLPPDADGVVFRNTALHASWVENGFPNGAPGYKPYARTRRETNNIIANARVKFERGGT